MVKRKTKQGSNEFVVSMQHFHRYLNDFIAYQKDFKLIQSGSTMMIGCDGAKWNFVDYVGVSGKGYHLCKYVLADANKFADENPNYFKSVNIKPSIELELQKANLNRLKLLEGKQMYAIDVNDCYWDIAYQMGVIKQDTYLRGLKNKNWKLGRNASIGSLNKISVTTQYVGGVKLNAEPVMRDTRLSVIRNNIVCGVHEMFMELIKKLGDNWLMYFTDCVYVPLESVEETQEFFVGKGFQTKQETYELDLVDLTTGKVCWYDYQKKVDKHFQFCERQLILEAKPAFMVELANSKIKPNDEF